jgi:hypothetical protein
MSATTTGPALTRQQSEWIRACDDLAVEIVEQARSYVRVKRMKQPHPYGSTFAVEELVSVELDCDSVVIDGPLSEIDAAPLNFVRQITVDGITVQLRFAFVGTVLSSGTEHGLCYEVEIAD